MNLSNISNIIANNDYLEQSNEKIIIIQEDTIGSILGSVSVFISAFLLSCGGFLAVIFSYLRRSNCKKVSCLGSECTRTNLNISED
jgi:hypothetical protein